MDSAQVTSWVCATIPMAGTVTYDCIPEVAALSPCLHLDVLCPPTNSLSVNSLAVTLSVAQIFEFPYLGVKISGCQNMGIFWWQVS